MMSMVNGCVEVGSVVGVGEMCVVEGGDEFVGVYVIGWSGVVGG